MIKSEIYAILREKEEKKGKRKRKKKGRN